MLNRNTSSRFGGLLFAVVLIFTVVALLPVTNASAQGEPFVELMRKDIQAEKTAILTAALEMTEEQGEVFWPIYREYQLKLSELGDARIALIKDYAENYDAMTDEKAEELAKTSFSLQEKKFSLLKKTHKKVSKEISPILATRFVQVENQILTAIDLQIASEMPLIK